MLWQTILITIVVFAVALTGMAIGAILSNRCLRGSCGGLANLRDAQGNALCEGCSNPSPDCRRGSLEDEKGDPNSAAATVDTNA